MSDATEYGFTHGDWIPWNGEKVVKKKYIVIEGESLVFCFCLWVLRDEHDDDK